MGDSKPIKVEQGGGLSPAVMYEIERIRRNGCYVAPEDQVAFDAGTLIGRNGRQLEKN